MDETPTEKVKRGNEGLALAKDRRPLLGRCSRGLPSSTIEFE